MYEKFPRLQAEVGLAVYVQQSLETPSLALLAMGYFLCSLVSPFAKARLNLGGCAKGSQEEGMSSLSQQTGSFTCFYNETNIKRKNEMIIC